MIEEVELKDFTTKVETKALHKKDGEGQKTIIPKKVDREQTTANSDTRNTHKILEIPQDPDPNNTSVPESKPLLAIALQMKPPSEETTEPAIHRLDLVPDSFRDVGLGKLKTNVEIPPSRQTTSTGDSTRWNRIELHFCQVIYFTMVFLSFAFAIYVFTRMARGAMRDRSKPN